MKDRNFIQWISFFITTNLFILTLLMLFAPAYPWWAICVLTLVSFFGSEKLLSKIFKGKSSTGRQRNRLNF